MPKAARKETKKYSKNINSTSSKKSGAKEYLKVSEAAKILELSSSSLRRFETEGKIKSERLDNNYREYSAAEVYRFKKQLDEEKISKKLKPAYTTPVVIRTESKVEASELEPKVAVQVPVAEPHISEQTFPIVNDRTAAPDIRFLSSASSLLSKTARFASIAFFTGIVALGLLENVSIDPNGLNILSFNTSKNDSSDELSSFSLAGATLGAKDKITNFVYNINVPAFVKNDLSVTGLSNLTGGIDTQGADANLGVGALTAGIINGVTTIDDTTETTLEAAIDINGDVVGTGLNDVKVQALGGLSIGEMTDSNNYIVMVKSGKLATVAQTNITQVGTIGTGTWEGSVVTASYGGTGLTSFSQGDLLVGAAGNTLETLPAGSANQILISNGTTPIWTDSPAFTASYSWTLAGNAATNENTNFLGTTDSHGLVIRTNNIERMRITATGNVGIGGTNPQYALQIGDGSVAANYINGQPESEFIEGDLEVAGTIYGTFIGSITTVGYNPNSIFYSDATGTMSADNTEIGYNETTNTLSLNGTLNATNVILGGTAITASAAELNILDGATLTTTELNRLTGVTVTPTEFNLLSGRTGTLLDTVNVANYVTTGVTAGQGLIGGGSNGVLTLNIGAGDGIVVNPDSISIDTVTAGLTATTSSNSGLELASDGLRLIGGCTADQILSWDAATSVWKCTGISNLGGVTGVGTAGHVAFWSGTTAITGNSNLYWDNADARLGISTPAPQHSLDVAGDIAGVTLYTTNLYLGGSAVTSSANELNILDGATLSTAELNILDGVNASTSEINLLAGRSGTLIDTNNAATQLSAWDQNASDDLTTATNFSGDVSGTYNNIQIGTGVIGNNELTSTSVSANSYGSSSAIATFTVDADGRLTAAGTTTLSTAGITNSTILAEDLNATSSPTSGQILTYDNVSGGFTWVNTGSVGVNYWQRGGTTLSPQTSGDYIVTTGRIGAGTTSPGYALDVTGDINFTGTLRYNGTQITTDQINEGITNLYYTDTRARAAVSGSAPIQYNSSTGVIGITQASTGTNGFLTSTDWNTFNNKLTATLNDSYILVGNGSNVATAVALSNDATISNTGALTLANSGVTANTYGSSTQIPVITVDAKGRVTNVTNQGISYESPLTFGNGLSRVANAVSLDVTTTGTTSTTSSNSGLEVGASGLKLLGGCTADQVLSWDATNQVWKCTDATASSISGTGASKQVAFWNGTASLTGSNAFWWDDSLGRLGIGTSNPGYALEVSGSANAVNVFQNGNQVCDMSGNCSGTSSSLGGTGSTNYLAKFTGAYSVGNSGIFETGGNVGIGTTNPLYTLHVSGSVNVTNLFIGGSAVSATATEVNLLSGRSGTLIDTNNAATQLSAWDQNASNDLTTSTSFSGDVSGSYNNLQLGNDVVGSTELAATTVTANSYGSSSAVATFTVDADGRLTAAGTTTLSTAGITNSTILAEDLNATSSPTSGQILTYDNVSGGFTWVNTGSVGVNYWQRNGTTITPLTTGDTVATTGNIGAGTTNPINKLDVAGGVSVGSYAAVNTAPSNGLIVSGRVGIGSTNPQYNLDVSGSANAATLFIAGSQVTAAATELNILDGATLTTAELNKLTGVTATSTEFNLLSGRTGTLLDTNNVGTYAVTSLALGNGLSGNSGPGGASVNLDTSTTGTTSTTSNNSGLETDSSGLRLLGGCSSNQVLSWDSTGNVWKCSSVSGLGGVTGSGAATQVAFWNTSSSITGTNSLWWANGTGRLGIGTSNPNYGLEVSGSANATTLYQNGSRVCDMSGNCSGTSSGMGGSGTINYLAKFTGAYAVGNTGIFEDASGNIGIGTTAPTHRIELVAGTTAPGGIAFGDVELYRDTTNRLALGSGDDFNLVSGNIRIGGTTVINSSRNGSFGTGITIGGDVFLSRSTANQLDLQSGNNINLLSGSYMAGGNVVIDSNRMIFASNGASSSPSYTFLNDADTGVYRAAINTIGLITNATEKVRIDGTGNVGIGTTNPQYRLDVSGSANVSNLFIGGSLITSSVTELNRLTGVTVTPTEFNLLSGRTGTLLDTNNIGTHAITSIASGSGLTGGTGPGTTTLNVGAGNGITVNADDIAVDTTTTGTTSVTSSNSGLETTAAGVRLVGGCSANQVLSWDNVSSTWKCSSVSGIGGVTGSGTDNYMVRWDGTGNIQSSSIYTKDTGEVGIGTTNPTQALQVNGAALISNNLYFGSTSNYLNWDGSNFNLSNDLLPSTDDTYALGSPSFRWADLYLGPASMHIGVNGNEAIIGYNTTGNYINFDPDGDTQPELILTDDGRLGIGTTNPQYALEVSGSANFTTLYISGSQISTSAAELNLLDGAAITTTELNRLSGINGTIISASNAATQLSTWDQLASDDLTTSTSFSGDISGTYNNMQIGTGTILASNLSASSPSNDQVLTYNSTSGGFNWINPAALGTNYWQRSGTTLSPITAGDNFATTGNIGAGTTNPQYRLDVSGSANVSNLFIGGSLITSSVTELNRLTGVTVTPTEFNLLSGRTGTLLDTNNVATQLSAWDQLASDDLTTGTTFGGDITGAYNNLQIAASSVGANELASTTVVSGSYGSITEIPVITVDADGRLTNVTTQSFSAESPLTFNNGLTRNTNTIGLGGSLSTLTSINLNGSNFGFFGTGNVGIGTTNPQFRLDISGSANATTLFIAGSQVTASATELNILDGASVTTSQLNLLSGRTGTLLDNSNIGSYAITSLTLGNGLSGGTGPGATALNLDVTTTGATSTASSNSGLELGPDGLRLLGGCGTDRFLAWDNSAQVWKCTSISDIGGVSGSGIGNQVAFWNAGSSLSGSNALWWDGSRLGIGTSAPSHMLEVSGSANAVTLLQNGNEVCDTSGNCSGSVAGLGGSGTTNYIAKWNNLYEITNSALYEVGGKLGIGTTAPNYTLDISGSANATTLLINGNVITSTAAELNLLSGRTGTLLDTNNVSTQLTTWDQSASDDLTTSTNFSGDISGMYNNMQIGTGAVGSNELAATTVVSGSYGSALQIPVITVDADGRLTNVTTQSFSAESPLTFNNGLTRNTNTIGLGGSLSTLTSINLNGSNFGFFGTGNVGIGTTNPQFRLDISGSANVSTLFIAGSQVTASATELNVLDGVNATLIASELNLLDGRTGTLLDSSIIGSYALTSLSLGTGLAGGTGPGAINLALDVSTTGTTSTTSNNSGLELGSDGLRLLGGCSANQVLAWDSANSLWKCTTMSSGLAGTGIDNYITRWDGTSALQTSGIYAKDTGEVGIGTTNPMYSLEVSGSANVSNLFLAGTRITSSATELNRLTGVTVTPTEFNLLSGRTGTLLDNGNVGTYAVTSLTLGNGLSGGTGPGITALNLDVATTGTTSTTSSNSGLEVTTSGLKLLGGCAADQILSWDSTAGVWKCNSVAGVGALSGGGATSQIAFWNGTASLTGSNAFWWNNTLGRLGIGTSNPNYSLEVSGSANATSIFQNGNQVCDSSGNCSGSSAGLGGSGTTNYLTKFTGQYTIGNSGLFENGSGFIGIGTTDPQYTLDVNGSIRVANGLYLAGATSSPSTTEGTMYYDTDDDQLKVYANGKWQADRTTATLIVGTSNSTNPSMNYEKADYVCGDTDCDTTIETAIAALPAGGGTVVLLEGTYVVDSNGIDITKSNVSLIGSGTSTILQRGWESTTSYDGVIVVGDGTTAVSSVSIESIAIDGQSSVYTGTTYNHGIYFRTTSDSDAKNNYIYDTAGVGIYLQSVDESEILNNKLVDLGSAGIEAVTTVHSLIQSNTVQNTGYTGIHVSGSSYNTIANNYVSDTGTDGISLPSSNYNTVIGNTISNITSASDDGINVTSSNPTGNNIVGNTLFDNDGARYPIIVSTTGRNNVTGNIVSGSGFSASAGTVYDISNTASIQQGDMNRIITSATLGKVTSLAWSSATTATGDVYGNFIDMTNLTPSNTSSYVAHGLAINGPAANTGSKAYGIYLTGNNWDFGIYSSSTSPSYLAGNLGIGTTAQGYNLNVAGSANVSTLFIAGSQVTASATELNVLDGVNATLVASELNLLDGRTGTLLDTNNIGSYSLTSLSLGTGLSGGTGPGAVSLALDVATTGTTSTTSSNSGLEIGSDGLRLLGGCSADQTLSWDATNSLWKCTTASSGLGGSGVDNYLARWDGTGALQNSSVYADDLGNVGIGTTDPSNLLTLQGTSSPQLRIGYDASKYMTVSVSSTGAVTLDGTGTGGLGFARYIINGGLSAGSLYASVGSTIVTGGSPTSTVAFNINPADPSGNYSSLRINSSTPANNSSYQYNGILLENPTANNSGNAYGINLTGNNWDFGIYSSSTSPSYLAGNLGIGTTAQGYNLNVAGSANVSTLFIAGSQVTASATELNVLDGVNATLTASELNLLDGRSGTLIDSGNISTYATTGVTAGNGLTDGGTNGVVTLNIGAGNGITVNADNITLDTATAGTTSVTSSNSGLEVVSDGLRLIGGCSTNQVLAWDATGGVWKCTSISGIGAVTGTGIDNYLARWDGTGALQNSGIYVTDTGMVGLGTTAPSSKLTLVGGNFTHTASGDPTLAGTYNTVGAANDVYVSGKYAYVADFSAGLRIIDISNPASPSSVGTYNTSGYALGVYVSGKYAYVTYSTDGLRVIDISNPASPSLVGTYSSSDARDVYVSGKYAYVADYTEGLRIVDISDPTSPSLVGQYTTAGSNASTGVYVSGKYAYVADGIYGLRIVDISNPASPSLVNTYDTNGSASDVYVSGRYAYVAGNSFGLQVINVGNPASLTLTDTYDTSGTSYGVYVSGKYAYVADYTSGLQVINISNPADLSLAGTYNTSGYANDVYVSGKYAYVADDGDGLQIIDINGIETPSLYAGNIATNAVTVTENIDIGNNLYVRNGINIGSGGILSQGNLAVAGSANVSTLFIAGSQVTASATELNVLDGVNATLTASELNLLDGRTGTLLDTNNVATQLSAWDQLASDDLTTGTTFAGDITGAYNNLQIAASSVGPNELANTTVTSGSYGSATEIPVITVDADGRLTNVTTQSISAESPLTFGNGLTRNVNAISLGGTLSTLTTLNLNSNDFGFYGTGSIGIGTTSPSHKLDVVGDIGVSGSLYLAGATSSPSTTEGTMYYDTDDDQLKVYANGKWQADRTTATVIVAATDSKNPEKADFVADGTDDNVTIESAISALPAVGGTVVLLEGTYSIGDTAGDGIDITRSTFSLVGTGRGTILQRAGDTASADGIITVGNGGSTNVTDVTISSLAVDGVKATYAGSENRGIYLNNNVDRTTIEKVYVHDNDGEGIYVHGSTTDSDDNTITTSDIRNNDGTGIAVVGANKTIVEGNIVYGNGNSGMNIAGDVDTVGSIISNNVIEANLSHGVTGNAYHTTFTGNTFRNNTSTYGSAIDIVGNYNNFTSNNINGNWFGLYVLGDYNSIVGNNFHNNLDTALTLGYSADYNIVSGNTITDTTGGSQAVSVSSGATYNYLSDNKYSGTGASTISDSGTGTIYSSQLANSGADLLFTPSGNVGIGIINPSYKLHVAGSANVSDLFIAGSRVSAAAGELNILDGATISTTELNLLDNRTGTLVDTNNISSYALTSLTAGSGLTGGTGPGATTLSVDATTTGTTSVTSSNSGLEATATGLRLLGGCTDGQSLSWDATNQVWKCAAGGGISGSGSAGQISIWSGTAALTGTNSFWWDTGNSRLGIGTTAPASQLNLLGTDTTAGQFRISYDAANYTKFAVDSTGALTLSNNGTNTVKFGATNTEFYVPTTFSASGDVSMAYDLLFTNQTSSQIESYGPFSIIAGENSESNSLTLKTYNAGNIIADLTGTGKVLLTGTDTTLGFDTRTGTDTDYWMGVIDDAAADDDDIFAIGKGLISGTNPYFVLNASGNVGIGTTSPSTKFEVSGSAPVLRITDNRDITWTVGDVMAGLEFYSLDNSGNYPAASTAIKSMVESTFGNSQGLGFFVSNDTANPVERMRLSNGGYLGIGTTSPATTLDIVGSTGLRLRDVVTNASSKRGIIVGGHYTNTEEDVLMMAVDSTNDNNIVRFGGGPSISKNAATLITFSTAANNTTVDGTERLRIDSSGNVGIGTSAPIAQLDVAGTAWLRGAAANQGLYVSGSGTVGIGTTAPSATTRLTIENLSPALLGDGVDITLNDPAGDSYNSALFNTLTVDSAAGGESYGTMVGVYNYGELSANWKDLIGIQNDLTTTSSVTSATVARSMGLANTIAINGHATNARGFGMYNDMTTANDAYAQDLYGNYSKLITYSSDNAYHNYATSNSASTGGTQYAYYGNLTPGTATKWGVYMVGEATNYFSGAVGIGLSNPSYVFQVKVPGSSPTGYVSATGAWATTSDARMKKNITTLGNELDKIMQTRPVRFDFNSDKTEGTGKHIGLIAQEFEAVFPEFVTTDKEGYKGISYEAVTPVLIKGIQELNNKIGDLGISTTGDLTGTSIGYADGSYNVIASDGSTVSTNGVFAGAAVGELNVGDLTAQDGSFASLKVAGKSLDETIQDKINIALESYTSESTTSASGEIDGLSQRLMALEQLVLGTTSESSESSSSGAGSDLLANLSNFFNIFTLGDNDAVEIASDVNILGDLTVNNLYLTGDFSAGQVKIDSLNNSLQINGPSCYNESTESLNNELCDMQTLFIQKNLAGNIDFMDGKVIILADGTVKVNGAIEAKEVVAGTFTVKESSSSSSEDNTSDSSVGSAVIEAGNNSITIDNTLVENNSKIFVTATSSTNGQALIVSQKTEGESFMVELDNNASEDVTFDWWIVNVR